MIDEQTRIQELEAEVKRLEGHVFAAKRASVVYAASMTPFLERLLRLDQISGEELRHHKATVEYGHVVLSDDVTAYCQKYGEHPE